MLLTIVRVALALALYAIGAVVLGLAAGIGYFLFGLSLIVLTVLLRILCRLDLKEGEHPVVSIGMFRWYVSNALQFLVWSTSTKKIKQPAVRELAAQWLANGHVSG